jgi:hypothetical protein
MGIRMAVVAAVAAPAAVALIGAAMIAQGPAPPAPPQPPAAVQTVTGGSGQPAPSSSQAAKSHTVAQMVAGHMVHHLVPHVPYVFRPRVFRGPRLLRGW